MNQIPIETKDVTSIGLLNIAAATSARAADSRSPLEESPAVQAGAAR
jgi:hypothetical protein